MVSFTEALMSLVFRGDAWLILEATGVVELSITLPLYVVMFSVASSRPAGRCSSLALACCFLVCCGALRCYVLGLFGTPAGRRVRRDGAVRNG